MFEKDTRTDRPLTDVPALMSHLASRAPQHRRYISSKIPQDIRRLASPDDILQDAWATMFRDIARVNLSGTMALDCWASTVINRAVISTCRRLRTLKRGGAHRIVLEQDHRADSLNLLMNRVASHQKTPSRELSSKEAVRALRLALASLPEDRQRAIVLCHIEGRSRQAVAAAMNRTPAAVNSLVYRGLKDLRQHLGSASRFFSGKH